MMTALAIKALSSQKNFFLFSKPYREMIYYCIPDDNFNNSKEYDDKSHQSKTALVGRQLANADGLKLNNKATLIYTAEALVLLPYIHMLEDS